MGSGRFLCVAVPFGLTLASLVCIMIAMLAGVTDKKLDMFEVNTANMSISSSSLANLENLITRRDLSSAVDSITSDSGNISASTLGLADKYRVSLWNYCSVTGTNVTCSKSKFNWAAKTLNTSKLEATASATTGVTVTLPSEVKTSLKTFATVSKWTQVVYILAIVSTALELLFGIIAMFSRAGSCCALLVSAVSTISIIAGSIMATAMSSTVVGALKSFGQAYDLKASLNTRFLATTWVAAAFSIGSGLFWMSTICCCAPDHSSKPSKPWSSNRNIGPSSEKYVPASGYQRVSDPETSYAGQQHGIYNNATGPREYGVPMHNVRPQRTQQGYEPYSHTAI